MKIGHFFFVKILKTLKKNKNKNKNIKTTNGFFDENWSKICFFVEILKTQK